MTSYSHTSHSTTHPTHFSHNLQQEWVALLVERTIIAEDLADALQEQQRLNGDDNSGKLCG